MASPVQLFPSFPMNDSLFATPNFDEGVDGSNNQFSYFDSLNSGSDSMLLQDDFQQWSSPHQQQRMQNQVLDPLLAGPSESMFAAPELSPPNSASDDIDMDELFRKPQTSRGKQQKLPALDTKLSLASSSTSQRYGQITPPLSSKSPETESIAERTEKPKRKPRRKPKKESASPPTKQSKPTRKGRKSAKTDAEKPEEEDAEEGQTEEAKAKRARFLERNRQAAFTCRQRKKEWARDLEDRHRTLERDNQNLKLVLTSLKDEFHYLRQQVVGHSTCECSGAREYIQRTSKVLESGEGTSPVDLGSPLHSGESAPLRTPVLEQTLRTSLGQFDGSDDSRGIDPADTSMTEPEGPELDGMTI